MHQLKCRIWLLRSINRILWMQGQGMGSLGVPWAQSPQGQSAGWRGSKDRGKRNQSNPLRHFRNVISSIRAGGSARGRTAPRVTGQDTGSRTFSCHRVWGVPKPLFVTWFALGTGLRKVDNSWPNCKYLFKNHTAFQVKNRFMLATNLLVNLLESLQWFFTEIVRYRSVKVHKIFNTGSLITL